MADITEPCPHRKPNAGGTEPTQLHGVCIFCWRDRAAASEERARQLESDLADLVDCIMSHPDKLECCYADESYLIMVVRGQTPQHSPEGRPPEGHDNDDFIPCGDHCGEVTCELEKGHWEDHQRTEDGEVTWWPIDYDETPPKEPASQHPEEPNE